MRISDWSSDVCSSDLEFYNQQDIVTSVFVVRGFSFFGQGQANGMMFTMLKPWEERSGEENSSLALVGKAMGFFTSIKEAMVFALNPPAIAELGIAGGFTFKLEDVGGNGAEALFNARNQLLAAASQSPILAGVRPEGQEDAPQLRVMIDRIQ